MPDPLAIAIGYIRRKWSPVPVPYRQKGPMLKGWDQLRLTEKTAPRYFNGGLLNVGVLLGAPSDHIVDVDLDCPGAIEVAPRLLPATIKFGRTTAPGSHWIYRSEFPGAAKATIAFDDPISGNPEGARLVELRTGQKGAQTVFPGSVHMSGEPITWEDDGERQPPADIDSAELTRVVARVAAAALLARYWPPKGNRHDLSLALGGALARSGWEVAAIEVFLDAVVRCAHDPRPADRVRCARDAAEAVADGQQAYGFPKLKEILGDVIADKLAEWLGFSLGSGAAPGGRAIHCGPDLTATAEAAERALAGSGLPLFRRDTQLVRPVTLEARGANDQPIQTVGLAQLSTVMMRSFMEQCARFEKFDARQKEWARCKPPEDIAELILARTGYWPFPQVRGVLAAPSLRPDGSLLDQPGYDAATGMYLMTPPAMPDIPAQPTMQEGRRALDVLDGLLDQFPWCGDDDARAVGLSILITPLLRAALPTAPLHAISAPEAGTGKSYLTQIAAGISTGFPCPVITTGKDEEETEKRLGASLLAGHALLSIDNVSRPLGGDFLCQLLDQPLIKVRILGQSAGPLIEPRLIVFATGNNLTLVGDIVRRAVVAHMDAAREDPWHRQFKSDPLARVLSDRGKYIAAALTVCRAFLASGEPPETPLLSFERWSRMVRSALVWLGAGDPVKTIASAVAEDPERQNFAAVLAAWSAVFDETEVTTAEVIARANERDTSGAYTEKDLRDALLAVAVSKGGEVSHSRLGNWLRVHRDRVIGRRALRRRGLAGGSHVARWCVLRS